MMKMIMRMMLLLLLVLLTQVLAAASSSSSSSAAVAASAVLVSCEREAQQSQACRNELVAQTNPGGPLPQGFEYLSGEALRNRCLELTTVFTRCRDDSLHTNKLSHQHHERQPPPSAVKSSIDPTQIPRNKETNNHRKNPNHQRQQQQKQRQRQQQQRHRGPVTIEDIQQLQVFDPMKIMLLGVCVLSWLAHAMGWLQQYEITTDHNTGSGGDGGGGTDTHNNPGTTATVLPSPPASPHIRKENSNSNSNSSSTIQQREDTTHKKLL